MIAVGERCERRMTLFHHLKLKRPRIDVTPPAMAAARPPPPTNGKDEPRKDPSGRGADTPPCPDDAGSGGSPEGEPPHPDGRPSSDDSDAMPRLERQNSVFDGGGPGTPEVLPHLSPQLWPPSNTLAYHRHFGPGPEGPPPPLLMGDVRGRGGGKTMVWAARAAAPAAAGAANKGSPSPPRATSTSPSASSQQFEPQPLISLFRHQQQHPLKSLTVGPACSSKSESPDEDSSSRGWQSPEQQQQQLPDTQALNLCVASTSRDSPGKEDEQQMVCMICEDRATGLHYGIITCEGCKGFFKRTVQNKRVYTCVAEGNCEVTKAQRNRCQYCRFQKCVRQGMVLAAVREDRMPGGRNSGAVYNLYKVKYKKHRRGQKNGHVTQEPPALLPAPRFTASDWANGQILKTALTSPADVIHLRPLPETNCVTSSRGTGANQASGGGVTMTPERAEAMIRQLVECEAFEDVAKLKNAKELLQCKMELNDKLCHIGDNIVYKLVQWAKRLPFYNELPVAVHTQLLTRKWHELLVLTACAFQAIRGSPPSDVTQAVSSALCSLRECLAIMVGVPVGLEELREAGPLVERLALLADSFRRMGLSLEEYVCLKVVIMQAPDEIKDQKELEEIHERYMMALRIFVEQRFPQQTTRFTDLLSCIPEIKAAASLVVQSKMFYVPLLLNTSLNK